jgi:methyl-accepting chemotaxis protein
MKLSEMKIQAKLMIVLIVMGLVSAGVFSAYMYRRTIGEVRVRAHQSGMDLIGRSAEMFLVSTRRFHDDFARTKSNPEECKKILDDWTRTIYAVDQAVITDHGEDKGRVRLIGDAQVFGYKPLGGENTKIEIGFETRAARELMAGKELVQAEEDGYLRLAAPLWSNAHEGCAECHFATVDGIQSDMSRKVLLGTLNAYVPLAQPMAEARKGGMHAILFVIAILALTICAIYVFMNKVVIRPLRRTVDHLRDIAEGEGDLTARIAANTRDEVGELAEWFNTFVGKIRQIIHEVSRTSSEVAAAATEIAASSEEMAAHMEDQSAQISQISATIGEMSASVVEVARQTSQASDNARHSGQIAEEGGRVVAQTIEDMQAISQAVSSGAASVTELGKRGERIGEIIGVINDIADQTNLLALNAAIEAARAGEHGRGFAVVADEVRKLADRTTRATGEVAQAIRAIQDETGQAVEKMDSGTRQVEQGVERAQSANRNLCEIVTSARDVAGMIQSIAATSEQQSAASEQIGRSVDSISATSRQASEGASQAAAAACQLSFKAEHLRALVSRFKVE